LFGLSLYLRSAHPGGWLTRIPQPSLPIFWGLVLFILFFARRLHWPRWSASWIGYGLVLLLSQFSLFLPSGALSTLAGISWLAFSAVVLFWLARRDWIAGLLAVLPVTPMWIWLPAWMDSQPPLNRLPYISASAW
jgi:hypothetical protein